MPTFVITGASSGIGHAIATFLLSTYIDVNVFLVARREDKLQQFVSQYGAARVGYLAQDLSLADANEKLVAAVVEKFGAIDGLVANAGVLDPVDSVENVDIAQWKRLFDINYFSVVDLVSKALPYLKKANGNVVLVSSGASTKSTYGWAAYGASKAAINHFAICVAAEVPSVKIVAVAPGVVDTDMQKDIRDTFGSHMTPEALQRFVDLKKNDQLLKPEYVAKLYGNLLVKGIPSEINGGYFRYSDAKLASFFQ